jgi:hypothetical protein
MWEFDEAIHWEFSATKKCILAWKLGESTDRASDARHRAEKLCTKRRQQNKLQIHFEGPSIRLTQETAEALFLIW